MKPLELFVESRAAGGQATSTTLRYEGPIRGEVFWEFSGEFLPAAPSDADFALVAMLPLCMHRGFDVRVHGSVNRDLLEAVEECMDIWTSCRADLFKRRVEIVADDYLDQPRPASDRSAVLTFSGGVDATFALTAHQRAMLGRRSTPIAAGLMVHGFDIPLQPPDWFEKAATHARAIVHEQDTAFTSVRTNWREVCVDWTMSHGFGLFAVLHQFHGRVRGGVIASDYDYFDFQHAWGNNSLTNFFLSGASFPIRDCGGGYSRTTKVEVIGQSPAVREHLRVCWERPELGGNCGRCEKCVRTQLNFLAAGLGQVPAFPGPLTASMVKQVGCKNSVQHQLLAGTLKDFPRSNIPPDIRAAVQQVLAQPFRRRSLYRAVRERLRLRRWWRLAMAR